MILRRPRAPGWCPIFIFTTEETENTEGIHFNGESGQPIFQEFSVPSVISVVKFRDGYGQEGQQPV